MKNKRRTLAVFGIAAVAAASLTACDSTYAAATATQCAAIVGVGGADHDNKVVDRNIHKILFPGQTVQLADSEGTPTEVAQYFACGPRNYKINDGSIKDANGHAVGDRDKPTVVWTKAADGKPSIQLNIWSTTYWTPNQGHLFEFYALCAKYPCYTEDAGKAAQANYSEPGWNGMLGENFGGTIDTGATFIVNGSTKELPQGFTSDLVQNTNDWVKLGDAMSADFMTRIHSVTGISGVDLFCGSGNGGGWKDPAKPGQGEFTCLNVHTVIDKVEETDVNLRNARSASSANALQQQVNEQRVAQAKTLYGENWGYFLGVQDTIDKCKQGGQQVCVINFGNGNVSVPVGGNR